MDGVVDTGHLDKATMVVLEEILEPLEAVHLFLAEVEAEKLEQEEVVLVAQEEQEVLLHHLILHGHQQLLQVQAAHTQAEAAVVEDLQEALAVVVVLEMQMHQHLQILDLVVEDQLQLVVMVDQE
jgi:hypothetical protein